MDDKKYSLVMEHWIEVERPGVYWSCNQMHGFYQRTGSQGPFDTYEEADAYALRAAAEITSGLVQRGLQESEIACVRRTWRAEHDMEAQNAPIRA